ncbi:MAG TPA: hypothetical protein VL966_11235 [Alphaproteobacteria bacterium]|nr:hypothetical protein [Alphaproteobacteria bacterium]
MYASSGSTGEPLPFDPSPSSPSAFARWNFVVRHWRGELPLVISYWIIDVFGSFVAVSLAPAVNRLFDLNGAYDPLKIFWGFAVFWTAMLGIRVWQIGGVWRSASRYASDRRKVGRRTGWATAAKAMTVLSTLAIINNIAFVVGPQGREMYAMAFLDDPRMPPYAIRLMRDATEIEVAGGFKYGLTRDFLALLKTAPNVHVVHLNSVGGRLGEADKLYVEIRKRGLTTYVASQCLSACTIAYAAGSERWIRRGAEIGFHSPAFPGTPPSAFETYQNRERKYFQEAGFDATFAARAVYVPASTIWKPTLDELVAAKVVTNVAEGTEFAASGFGVNVDADQIGQVLSSGLLALKALREKFPTDYSAITEAFLQGYREGRTERELVTDARLKILPLVRAHLASADDDVLIEVAKLAIAEDEALNRVDPALCYAYASGRGNVNVGAHVPADINIRGLELEERILRSSAPRAAARPEIIDNLWNLVWSGVARRRSGNNVALLRQAVVQPAQYGEYCAAVNSMFREILLLRTAQAAIVLRDIYSKM